MFFSDVVGIFQHENKKSVLLEVSCWKLAQVFRKSAKKTKENFVNIKNYAF